MVKKILIIYCLLLFYSCGNKEKFHISEKDEYFMNNFKQVYFCSCLKYGFNQSSEIKQILAEDKSSSSDFLLGLKNYKLIDSLALITRKEIKKDSIISNKKRAEGAKGKRVFKYCLDKYNSKWLDSLAYTKLRKQEF